LNQQTKAYNWSLAHAVIMLFSTGIVLLSNNMMFFVLSAFTSFIVYIFNNLSLIRSFKPIGGYANWITFFRMLLLMYIALHFESTSYIVIVFVFIVNILLDILDGIVARKFETESTFGLYFDMELDAFYVCLASIILYLEGLTGIWIIWIGLLRYIFTFLMVLLNINIASEPKQKFASWVAGILFWCLLLPFYNVKLNMILGMVGALVIFSFVKSFLFQINRQ